MIEIRQCLDHPEPPGAHLTLPFEKRQKSRLRVNLDNGVEASLILPRGTVLRNGDLLRSEEGLVVLVCAADEEVTTVRDSNPLLLVRASYHLGNRHVPLQIGQGWIRYQRDHVLDHMVESLGLTLTHETAPFEPEPGAYGASHNHT